MGMVAHGINLTRSWNLWRCPPSRGAEYDQAMYEFKLNLTIFSTSPTFNIWLMRNSLTKLHVFYNHNFEFN